jgi:hypothetical protein
MSDDMIERVAGVLFDRDFNGEFGGGAAARMIFGKNRITYAEVVKGVEDGTYTESSLSRHRASARAVIAAMREPTEAMARCEPYESQFPEDTSETVKQSWRDEYANIWRSMIDTALAVVDSSTVEEKPR